MVSVTLTVIAGARSGSVIFRNRRKVDAPSTADASSSSSGMPSRPARYMTIERPTNCQTRTTKIVQSAQVGSPVHARWSDSSPMLPSNVLSGPVKLKMNCQT